MEPVSSSAYHQKVDGDRDAGEGRAEDRGDDGGATSPYRVGREAVARLRKRALRMLLWPVVCGLTVAGVGMVVLTASDDVEPAASIGAVMMIVGMSAVMIGVLLALFYGAIAGGEAIWQGGGWIGAALVIGIVAAAGGEAIGALVGSRILGIIVVVTGMSLMVGSVIAFWAVGWIAKVPMWVQAPVFGSPRVYVRGQGDAARPDVTLPNALDDSARERRHGRHAQQGDHAQQGEHAQQRDHAEDVAHAEDGRRSMDADDVDGDDAGGRPGGADR